MEDKEKQQFEAFAAEAYERLPLWVKEKMNNVAITVEDLVDSETIEEMGLDSDMDLLGIYKGTPLIARDNSAPISFPDTIVLYRMPIQDEADMTGKPVKDVVFETLWHEIAHHFGLNEDQVEKREKEEFD